ncbi:hypothetical protein H8K20_07205 [Neobittarella massiliensis]|uniref:Rad50/SbcC-type AAA domain-containing protein n=1 Tax=Neobittarella massiliensis (ex Bilen et al. 2018) TaxID=2041842 RepID=A0A8J6LV72_9FIRM|nr:hypothetical protein [Neobittarella massiliensis]MBC3516180.1 hypothetical protein [Neobittarella massiliensis]
MRRMILTKLTLSGVGKKDAVLTFERGLNVITGDSDTGKTFAFQCINYILGGENPPKNITEAKDYNAITLEFTINDELYRIERTIGSSKVCIVHNGEHLIMPYKHDPANTKNLSRYLLQLLQGHSENAHLIKNKQKQKRTLSFRDIVHLITVDETDIIAEGSSFQSIQYTEKTARKSILKYIITGSDDQNIEEIDDVENENIRRAGVVQFLVKKKDILKRKITEIKEDSNYQLYTKAETTQLMVEEISQLRNSISFLSAQITQNQTKVDELKKLCFEDDAKIAEFEILKQHYAEELKRNSMVSTYTDFLEQLPHLDCPVCHQLITAGVIDSDSSKALFEYFKDHAVQLKSKIQDLTYSINDIKERLESNKESIRRLLEENKQLSETIAEKQASLSKLNRNIATIRQLDAMKKSLEIYQQDLSSVELDIIAYSEKVRKSKESKNKSVSSLYDDYCSEIESVLKKWGFPENVDVTFDAETLDLSIDGKARSDWGKGYRAFILSAMVIGLMRYCFKNNRLHPGFVILDSPLVSLKERKKDESGEWIDDYMEKKMVEDILEEDCLHQVIIFENKDIKYGYQYNYVEFNHEGNAHKGFIPS